MKYFFIFFITYLFIFSPPFIFLPFGSVKIVLLLTTIFIILDNKLLFFLKFYKNELLLFSLISIYLLFRGLLAGNLNWFIDSLFMMLEATIPSYYIIFFFKNKFPSKNIFYELILPIFIFSSFITIFLVLNPKLNFWVKTNFIRFNEKTLITFPYRGIGISDDLLFGYAIVFGITISLILNSKISIIKKSIFSFFMLIPIIFNARIGFIPIFFFLFLSVLNFNYKRLISLVLLIVSGLGILKMIPNNSFLFPVIKWLGIDINSFTFWHNGSGTYLSNMNTLFNHMVVIPDEFHEIILGKGIDLFYDKYNNSDIGYILQLNFGGVVYILLLLILLLFMYFRSIRLKIKNYSIVILLFSTILICNYKGNVFIPRLTFRYFFFIYSIIVSSAGEVFIIKDANENDKS